MSSILVEVAPSPSNAHTGLGKSDALHQRVPHPPGPPRRLTQSPKIVYDQWANQLAPLASQHHMSEYSRIKYGHQGSPIAYTPLSLHVPDVVRDLRARQAKGEAQVLWWPCPPLPVTNDSTPMIPATEQRAALAIGDITTPHPQLQQELSNAISESIPSQSQTPGTQNTHNHSLQVKTSETHPINISAIIPPESLFAISSHLTQCNQPSPVLFDIPFTYSLDRITGYAHLFPSLANSPLIPIRSASIPTLLPPLPLRLPQAPNELRPSVTDALHAALSTRISMPPLPLPSPRPLSTKRKCGKKMDHASTEQGEPQIDLAKLLTPRKSIFAPPTRALSQPPESVFPSVVDLVASGNTTLPRPFPYNTHPPTGPSPPRSLAKLRASTVSPYPLPTRHSATNHRSLKLGNLLLSSCPGKKVRLTGPVRGRGAVCRDLDLDLRRMKSLGAQCVVCCLDDEELQFLGISWTEYCQAAHREGLDVLRIPLPEGLAPRSPKSLDADLARIIERYTLHSISVLVHCRGGVGRAGLVACCWMLKLGLCGWIETDVSPNPANANAENEPRGDEVSGKLEGFRWDKDTVVRRDTLQLVERVIGVVRRRRSVKAIETLEQVQFLVEYVDYLRDCERVGETGKGSSDSEIS
ncbi:hypothetical protein HYDPIDRAFT_108404 [Hydnomerulius pinastri MD-312]|nr:hypothetical protein HYDPIDRAFT_108404 [Hydnomerulius pinastri MD-312]